jgi:hypothetical protein
MTYQFKIQISDVQMPSVWRRVLVSRHITFDEFHRIIQAAFGWGNYHLYQFSLKGWGSKYNYKIPDEFDGNTSKDSRLIKISSVFNELKQTFTYIYDFGDDWKHHIILEAVSDEGIIVPECKAGKGACPPEDCGGPWGYMNLKETLADPKHPDYKEIKRWLGLGKHDQWDADAFDIKATNERLRSLA